MLYLICILLFLRTVMQNYKGAKQKREPRAQQKTFGADYENRTDNEGLISGRNAVRELLASGRDIDKIFVLRGERDGSAIVLVAEAKGRKIPVIEVDKVKLDTLAGHNRHQGIVAMAAERNYCELSDILEYAESLGEKPFIIICDGREDPHNLGAIIRSAECSGAHGIVIPKRRASGLTSAVTKSSAGAIEYMRIAKVANIADTVDRLKERNVWVYAADMDGADYSETDFDGGCALVLGSEGFGISRLVKEKCDFVVSIPLYGRVNSLNVSNAAAVLMTEIARQRHKKG